MAIFGTFFKNEVSGERGGPLFLHTITVFWLGFEGLGLPGGARNEKKHLPKNHCFFEVKKRPPKPFFVILDSFLGSF